MFNQQDIFLIINPQDSLLIKETQTPLLKNVFTLNQISVNLILTDSYIVLTQTDQSSFGYYCPLTFSVKFQVIRAQWENQKIPGKPLGICIEKQNSQFKIQFLSNSSTIVDSWTKGLQKKINQRNFHKLFKAKKKIGKGAFATVYLAQSLVDGKMFAVKAFSKEKQYSGDKGRESLQNQIKIMRIIDHPNIVKLEGVYETDNSIYVILEYLQGAQLNEDLKSGKDFIENEIKTIIKCLLKGLSHLKQKRIIHRDLKPENIMFRRKDSLELAICDLGLATLADQQKYLFVRCGTPGFVAPEIINIRDMTIKSQPISDVFSVGIIFHYLLFKKSIFQGTKYTEILAQNRSCQFNFNGEEYMKLNKNALNLLMRMLQKRPQLRISAEQAVLHQYFDEVSSSQMQIEEQKIDYPQNLFKQKQFQNLQTPSTFKCGSNIKRKISNPMSRQKNLESFYVNKNSLKQNQTYLPDLKKRISGNSASTRSKSRGSYKNKMIDQIDENN